MSDTGIIEIHGKSYKTVALRVSQMREEHPHWRVKTKVIAANDDHVLIKASVLDENGNLVATGHAEETRRSGINKTSALENCETSAIGRCLAACGYLSTDYASEEEIKDANLEQQLLDIQDEWKKRMMILRDMLPNILAYKEAIAIDDYDMAFEAWDELSKEEKEAAYYPAPTQGGILTTKERGALKSNEMARAREKATGEII